MVYEHIRKGIFLERPNRFIAHIEMDGQVEVCHVKNTGRCRELLIPGTVVYVDENHNPSRKTRFSLISVQKGNRLINMDSQAPNKVFQEWLHTGKLIRDLAEIKPESKYEDSRFDFFVRAKSIPQGKAFIEVKGVTLEENNAVRFPDAPTERGVKHLEGLCRCIQAGYGAYVIFVIQMQGVSYFEPNKKTHPAFADALQKAEKAGVHILAYDCIVHSDELTLNKMIPVQL